MYAALELVINTLEFFLSDAQAVQHIEPLMAILMDIAKNSLSKVLHHVFCLSLLPFFIALIPFEITILLSLFGGTIDLSFKLNILEWFLEGEAIVGFLYDAHVIFGGFGAGICV